MVLLKNDGNVLPLDKEKIKTVLVVGPEAYSAEPVGAGSARVIPFAAVSALQGISTLLGPSATVYYEAGLPSVAAAADETKFVTQTKNGKPGLKLEIFRNAELSGKTESTQVVHHLNEPGITFDDLVLNPESMEELFNAKPKPVSKRWSGYFVARLALLKWLRRVGEKAGDTGCTSTTNCYSTIGSFAKRFKKVWCYS